MSYNWNEITIDKDIKINSKHIEEIRKYVDIERNIRNLPNYEWTDIKLTNINKIKTVHIKEIRENLEIVERIHQCVLHNITIDVALHVAYDNEHDTTANNSLKNSIDTLNYDIDYNNEHNIVEHVVDTNIYVTAKIDHNNTILHSENSNNDSVDKDYFKIANNIRVHDAKCLYDRIGDYAAVFQTDYDDVNSTRYIDDKISDNNFHNNNQKNDFDLIIT